MKSKCFLVLLFSFIWVMALGVLSACSGGGQSLEGLYVVSFQFNGGILDNGSTLVNEKISHAYQPNSLAIDISKYSNYSFKNTGYVFEGWYVDEALTDKWDFSTDRVSKDTTLYAKWEKAIKYSYSVLLVNDDGSTTLLGAYTVKEGDAFSDNTKKYTTNVLQETHAKTCIGLYSDIDLSEAWDNAYRHPGGEVDTDISVYVKAIEGVWTLVSNVDELTKVAAQDKNIYLLNDIDCQGKELYFKNYDSIFNGNGFTISNAKIKEQGTMTQNRKYSLFDTLGENCKIYDVTFDNIRYEINAYATQNVLASALAQTAEEGFEIENVTVNGVYTVTEAAAAKLDTGKLNQVLFDSTNQTTENVKSFTAAIVVEENN